MQNCAQTWVRQTLAAGILISTASFTCHSQDSQTDLNLYRIRTDSLFQVADGLCKNDSTSKLASSWLLKANSLSGILDDAQLREQYKTLDLQTEYALALNRILKYDAKGEFKTSTENNLAISTIDLCNLGLASMENARKHRSTADAEQAIAYFTECLENYKLTGESQFLVDNFWREENLDWKWIMFYKAVSERMAGNFNEADKEYGTLIKLGWKEPVLFLESADLQNTVGKPEESEKILMRGLESHPENASIACALTRIYLKNDKLKKAQWVIKPFDNVLGNNFEVAMTKALVYERKGDLKKADVLMKAVYKADPNEVSINKAYADYLLRKAATADKLDAEEFSQLAYNLVDKAIDLAPNNEVLKAQLADIKVRYPKVFREDELVSQ